jgi:hypothetical protein
MTTSSNFVAKQVDQSLFYTKILRIIHCVFSAPFNLINVIYFLKDRLDL